MSGKLRGYTHYNAEIFEFRAVAKFVVNSAVESESEPESLSEEEDDSELEEDEEEELELGDEPQSGSAARVRVRGPAAAAPSLFILRARASFAELPFLCTLQPPPLASLSN